MQSRAVEQVYQTAGTRCLQIMQMPASSCRLAPAMASSAPLNEPSLATVAAAHVLLPVMQGVWATQPAWSLALAPALNQPPTGVQCEPALQQPRPLQPGLPPPCEPTSRCTETLALTRGARRRLQQRLRKKLGKLERMKAASALSSAIPEGPTCVDMSEKIAPVLMPAVSSAVPIRDECQAVPIFVTEEEMGLSTLMLPTLSASGQKVVPVCSFQEDVKLHEDDDLEIMDVLVALPCQSKAPSKNTKQDERSSNDPKILCKEYEGPVCKKQRAQTDSGGAKHTCVADKQTKPQNAASTATWLYSAARIPTANTFVHFPAEREKTRRRCLSV